jgi:hypothetical protein
MATVQAISAAESSQVASTGLWSSAVSGMDRAIHRAEV